VNSDCYEFGGEVFDMSTFPSSHPLFDGTFKNVPGKFKIETKGKVFAEIVSLSPKNYSYRLLDPEKLTWSDSRRTKGIQRSVRDKRLTHADFVRQIHEPGFYSAAPENGPDEQQQQQNRLVVRRIGSERHTIFQYSTSRRGLTCFDDKRYLSANNVTTIPYGHYGLTAGPLIETWVPLLNNKERSEFLFPMQNDVVSANARQNEAEQLKRSAAKITARLEKHRAIRAKIEAQMPNANLLFDQLLGKQIAAGRLTQVQANYLKRNCIWNYARQLATGNNAAATADFSALVNEAGETEERRKWRRQNSAPKPTDQLKAKDLAGGYFVCPHMPSTVEEASRIKERNIRRAAEAAAIAVKRTAAAADAGSFMNLLPPAVKRRRLARLGLPARSDTASPAVSNDIEPEFDNPPMEEDK